MTRRVARRPGRPEVWTMQASDRMTPFPRIEGRSWRIVIAEDEPLILQFFVEALRAQGLTVAGTSDGLSALAEIRGSGCDLLITDLRLPGMDGLALLEETRRIDPDAAAIVVSGLATVRDAMSAARSGRCAFLEKPVSFETLLAAVKETLGRRREALHRRAYEEKLRCENLEQARRMARISLLRRVGEALHATLDVDELNRIVLTCVTAGEAHGFNRAFLLLVDPGENVLAGRLALGPASAEEAGRIWSELSRHPVSFEELLEGARRGDRFPRGLIPLVERMRFPLDDLAQVPARCARTQLPIVVRDAAQDPWVSREFREFLGADEFVCVPLVARGTTLGVILADNCYSRQPIDEERVEILRMFAYEAALALSNASLYAQLAAKVRELEETQGKLLRAERHAAFGRIASQMAHEIRNPLVSIGGYARRIRRDAPGEVAEYARIVADEVMRLERILANLLDFTSPAPPRKERTALADVAEGTLRVLARELESANVRVVRAFDPSVPQIDIDPVHLKQILSNLIQNAVQAMPDGGTLTLRTGRENGSVLIAVEDTGVGIPEADLESVFDPFWSSHTGGTGLGLAVSQKLARDNGGDLAIASEEGQGTTCRILFPA
ncbi:MAG: response regulator [Planctomycetes bacterium]|nr:response regulator [Planctomycetota bacterium]